MAYGTVTGVAALARRGVVREIRALRSRLPPKPERSTRD
jgi:hypothetical protein